MRQIVPSIVALILLILVPSGLCAQDRIALVAVYGADPETAVRFNFEDGKFISKEVLFKTYVEKNGSISPPLIKGRYLLTYNRTVYEHRPKDELTYDLVLNKFVDNSIRSKIASPLNIKEMDLRRSPDGKSWVNLPMLTEQLDQLVIHHRTDPDVSISGPFQVSTAGVVSIIPTLPLLWTDNKHLLTQRSNGLVIQIGRDGSIEEFPRIDSCTADGFPLLIRTHTNHIIYRCEDDFLLNTSNLSFKQIHHDLDYGFARDDGKLYYNDIEVGFEGRDELTTGNFIAVTDRSAGIGIYESSQIDTVRIWNATTKEWSKFVLDEGYVELIGWFKL